MYRHRQRWGPVSVEVATICPCFFITHDLVSSDVLVVREALVTRHHAWLRATKAALKWQRTQWEQSSDVLARGMTGFCFIPRTTPVLFVMRFQSRDFISLISLCLPSPVLLRHTVSASFYGLLRSESAQSLWSGSLDFYSYHSNNFFSENRLGVIRLFVMGYSNHDPLINLVHYDLEKAGGCTENILL